MALDCLHCFTFYNAKFRQVELMKNAFPKFYMITLDIYVHCK